MYRFEVTYIAKNAFPEYEDMVTKKNYIAETVGEVFKRVERDHVPHGSMGDFIGIMRKEELIYIK